MSLFASSLAALRFASARLNASLWGIRGSRRDAAAARRGARVATSPAALAIARLLAALPARAVATAAFAVRCAVGVVRACTCRDELPPLAPVPLLVAVWRAAVPAARATLAFVLLFTAAPVRAAALAVRCVGVAAPGRCTPGVCTGVGGRDPVSTQQLRARFSAAQSLRKLIG